MIINSNGSKWAGEEPDSIEMLIEVLKTNTLDPTFEKYGNFFHPLSFDPETGRPIKFRAFGNFYKLSHVFNIDGTLEELLPLARAIKENRRSVEYQRARFHPFSFQPESEASDE